MKTLKAILYLITIIVLGACGNVWEQARFELVIINHSSDELMITVNGRAVDPTTKGNETHRYTPRVIVEQQYYYNNGYSPEPPKCATYIDVVAKNLRNNVQVHKVVNRVCQDETIALDFYPNEFK